MIIYCKNDGTVQSIPSSIPFGYSKDVLIYMPLYAMSAELRIAPPSGEYLQPIIAQKVGIDTDTNESIFVLTLPVEVTATLAGRADYQVLAYTNDGELNFNSGTFNIKKGVPVEVPETLAELKAYNLESLHELLAGLGLNIEEIKGFVGTSKNLETNANTVVGAINELKEFVSDSGAPVDPTFELSGYAADAKLVGERFKAVSDDIEEANYYIATVERQASRNEEAIGGIAEKVDALEKETEEMAEAISGQGVLIAQQAKASKEYTDNALSNLVGSAPAELDTLHELATALGENKNMSQTILQQLANKVSKEDIVNSLDSTDTKKPLSAAQGKTLHDAIQMILENGVGDAVAGEVIIRDGSTNEAVENAINEHYNGKNLYFEITGADDETEKCALIGINNTKGLLFFITNTTKEIVTVNYKGTDNSLATVSFTPLSVELADDFQDYDKAARASMVGEAVAYLQNQIDNIDTSGGIAIDKTLKNPDEAADAKAVGDKIAEVEEAVVKRDGAEMDGDLKTQDVYPKATATYSLGTKDIRYKEIHGNIIYEAGTPIAQKYITDINAKKYTDDKVAEVVDDVSKNAEDIDYLKTRVSSVEEFNVNTYNTLNNHTEAINSLGERVTALEDGEGGSVSEEVLETFEFITEADIDEICGTNIESVSWDKGAF